MTKISHTILLSFTLTLFTFQLHSQTIVFDKFFLKDSRFHTIYYRDNLIFDPLTIDPDLIKSNKVYSNCDLIIYNLQFKKDLFLVDLKLNKRFSLESCNIKGQLNFYGNNLNTCDIGSSKFNDAYIEYSELNNDFNFSNNLIYGSLIFLRTTIKGKINFVKDTFDYNVNFKNCSFNKNSELTFKDSYIDEDLTFSNCIIEGKLDISLLKNINSIRFEKCLLLNTIKFPLELPQYLDFSNSDLITKEIDLLNCTPRNDTRCRINLYNANVSKIKFNYSNFILEFPEKIKSEEILSLYQKLLAKFKNEGFEESYKLVDIEYKQYTYNLKNQWLINFINKIWWNYGYDKELIIRNTLCLFLLFFICNIFIFRRLISDVYSIPSITKALNFDKYQNLSIFKNIVLCFAYSFIIFFGISLNIDKMNFKKQIGLSYLIIFYLIGLACNAFLIGYILNK